MPARKIKIKTHLPFVAFLVILASYLGAKSFPEVSWSGWTIFSAQTMLSSQYWAKDGFIQNKFLFIPIGYSKVAPLLDEPPMRHHARGTVSGGLIGKRLYYTHYPSGYLIPYGLLMKAGVIKRPYFRLLSLAFSLISLAFLYAFFNSIATPAVSFLAIFYYGGSTAFLDFADSLANQPIDDMLRFIILFLSLAAFKEADEGKRFRYRVFVWLSYFILSISSYDSTFFVFVWLVGFDLSAFYSGIEERLRWKRWVWYALAPLSGFALQVAQNWWYLGFENMLLDFYGTFVARANTGNEEGFFRMHLNSMLLPLRYMTGLDLKAAVALAAFVFSAFFYTGRKEGDKLSAFVILSILAAAALPYTAVFSFTGFYKYEGRQWGPALSLLIASATVMSARFFLGRDWLKAKKAVSLAAAGLIVALSYVWYAQAGRTVEYVGLWPNNAVSQDVVDFLKMINSLTEGDTVVFYINKDFENDYPQPDPLEEYYSGRMILNFRELDDMARDYRWLKERSRYSFDAVIVSSDIELLREFAAKVRETGEMKHIMDAYAFVIKGA